MPGERQRVGDAFAGRGRDAEGRVAFAAGISDALDGFAARRLNSFSEWGAALDPIADKVLVTVAFLSLAWVPDAWVVLGLAFATLLGMGAAARAVVKELKLIDVY